MDRNLDNKIYLLYHHYEYGKNNENEEIKILGIYSSKQEALKAIERYYKLEGFSKSKYFSIKNLWVRPRGADMHTVNFVGISLWKIPKE